MYRSALSSVTRPLVASSVRTIHSSPISRKTATEKVKEVADTVNKKVGKGLASAIDKGEQATEATKEAMGSASAEAKEKSKEAEQKANQAAAGAREAKDAFKKEVKK
ncbi:hypothetical protein K435DRAFT_673748 [Dendrothele bispora CBS 962.96]|uniref:Uncharacterized protein n=1 Tax=Dendrothele bispora (strain CBS 962.96) TaxID=1314807 RepID=A0A4S8LQY6_DENBC|nr:hypothetical protein K435DRAFT_673748 [Dendrothele bispora CBS 962.96]